MKRGRKREIKYLVGDFETTVYEGQVETEVWASAIVEMYTEDVKIFHSIGETFDYLKSLNTNIVCFYHNLKFDGNFWLYYLLNVLHYKQATIKIGDKQNDVEWEKPWDMESGTFCYTISDMGQWYSLKIKVGRKLIELRDSLKLLPFSVKKLGKDFNTKHKKLEMEYKGLRYAGCPISEQEKEYIANDVLVVKEALEVMFNEGHKEITIGSCCLKEYKSIMGSDYDVLFPDLTDISLHESLGSFTADNYIRHSYKGGWCYLVKGKENRLFSNGTTADVNSLYPSMMSSESGNRYPVGLPIFWKGEIPAEVKGPDKYYFVRLRTRFYLKEGKLPFIQIKGNWRYKSTEMLETSDVINKATGEASAFLYDEDNNPVSTAVTLTLTMTDYELLLEHYHLVDCEILDGCWFHSEIGIFDEYINKYKELKLRSKGALRALAKLFLNNLYGKMASNTNSSWKLAFTKEDGSIGFMHVDADDKKAGFIPVGSAITSYARNFTIRAAQKNYHGVDQAGFIYADTDSIHCDLSATDIEGIKVHNKNFCCWKLESSWDSAKFIRQKTYMEHVVAEDLNEIPNPYWNIKCAGMPDRCKNLFLRSMQGDAPNEKDPPEAVEFLKTKRSVDDYGIGLRVPLKLLPKRIKGGVILMDTYFEMRR